MGWYEQNTVLIQTTFAMLLFALSIQVPLRFGVYSFAGVGAFAIGGYTSAILLSRHDLPALVSVLAGALAAALACWALSLLVVRLDGLYLAMATVAFDLIVGVVAINGGDLTGGATGVYGVLTDVSTAHFAGVAIAACAVVAWTEHGRFGRQTDAVRENPELAASMGVRVASRRRIGFTLSGLLGGASGALLVLQRTTISPADVGFGLVVIGLTMIVVGGTASWVGALIGAVVFTWLPSLLEVVGEWQHVIYGVVVTLAAVWLPGGIVGIVRHARRRSHRRRHPIGPASQPAPVTAEAAS